MPQQIPPQPTPTVWGFDHTEDGKYVVVVANTPLGTFVHFLQVENADPVCAAIQSEKEKALIAQQNQPQADDDIVVPGQVLLDANGAPLMSVGPSEEVQEHLRKMRAQAIDTKVIDAEVVEETHDEAEGETGDSQG